MAYKRVYLENVKKFMGPVALGVPLLFLFAYLSTIGAITITGYSGDVVCEGNLKDPCYAYINFTANLDIYIYPNQSWYFSTDKPVKSAELMRKWGTGWRIIDLNKTWDSRVKYAVKFSSGQKYEVRIKAYKNSPLESVKWSFGDIDPVWLSTSFESDKTIFKGNSNLGVEVKLLEGYTPICFTECHLPIGFKYNGAISPATRIFDASNIGWVLDKLNSKDDIDVKEILWLEEYDYNYSIWVSNVTCEIKTDPNMSKYDVCTDNGKYEEKSEVRDRWVKLPDSITLNRNEYYAIDIVGKRMPKLGSYATDLKPSVMGLSFPEMAWWNTTWNKCRKITNSSQSNFPAHSEINLSFYNTSIPFADLMANGADLRYTNGTDCNTDSGSLMNFYIGTCNTSAMSSMCEVWINASENQTSFLVYYNASGASTASNGLTTWHFFDDFSDNDGSDWTVLVGTWTFSSGYANGTTTNSYLTKNGTVVPAAWMLKYRMMIPSTGGTVTYAVGKNNDSGYGLTKNGNSDPDYSDIFRRIGGSNANQNESSTCCTVDNNWHNYKLIFTGTTEYSYKDDVLMTSFVNSQANNQVGRVRLETGWTGTKMTWDDIMLGIYVASPPSWSIGAEETQTGDATGFNITLNFPLNNTWNTSNSINFGFTPNVTSVANCSVWGNFSGTFDLNQTNTSIITNNAVNTIATTVPDGTYLWNVECCNSTGDCNFSVANWTLKIDSIRPTITISSPINGTAYSSAAQDLKVGASETVSVWKYQYNGNGTNITFTPNTTFYMGGSDGIKNITVFANDSAGNSNSSTVYFYLCTASPVLYLDNQSINRKYEYGTNANLKANCTCEFATVCINMTGYGQLNCSTQNVTYIFSADAKEYLFNDSISNLNLSYGNGASNKTAYVFMHSRDEIGSFKVNLTGYYTNNSFPTNVKVWLNNTLLYSVSQLSTGTVTASTFNDSTNSKNFTQLDSGSQLGYINIPYGSNVTSAYMNVTGYQGPWNEKMATVDSDEQFYYNMTNQSMPGGVQYHLRPSDWATNPTTYCYVDGNWLHYSPIVPSWVNNLNYIAEGWPCYLNGIGNDRPIYYGYQNMSGYGVNFNWTFPNSTMPLAIQNRIGNWSDVDFVNCTNSTGTYTYNTTTGGTKTLTNIARGDECKIYTKIHTSSSMTCYQEHANISTSCGGLNTGTYNYTGGCAYDCSNWRDGDWGTYTYVYPSTSSINYTKQAGANNSSLWQVKDQVATVNLTIPLSCWDYDSSKLMIRVILDNVGGPTIHWQCFNTSWINLREVTAVFGAVYEEAIWWNGYRNNYTLYNTSYPTDIYIDVENDGTVDWNYTGNYTINNRTGDLAADFNHYLTSVCVPIEGVCKIPISFGNSRGGTLEIKNISINYTMSINPVSLNATIIQNYLQALAVGYTNIPLKFESQSNGTINLNALNVSYYGYQNYTVNATQGTLYNNKTLEVSYSNISAAFPPYIDFYRFVPQNRTQMNVTPFGQNYTQFAMNLTVKNYHDTVNISIFFNATPDTCKNMTMNTIGNKTGGRIINTTRWTPYTNLAYMNSTFYWFWMDVVNCSYAVGWLTDYLFIEPICYNCLRDW